MKKLREVFGGYSIWLILLSALTGPLMITMPASGASKTLDLDRLYSLPWLIGTKPLTPVWSPDSQRVAFLWNDAGTNFYDVWITDITSRKATRITAMPQPEMPVNPGTDIAKLEQVAAAESASGVSELTWAADGKHLLFVFQGVIYKIIPGSTQPERLVDLQIQQGTIVAAPKGDRVAFLAGGALYVTELSGGIKNYRALYTPQTQGVEVEEFHWSHDGTQIVFIETDNRKVVLRGIPDYLGDETRLTLVRRPFPGEASEARRLGVVSAQGQRVHWLALGGEPSDQYFTLAWSPDDKSLLIDKSDIFIKNRQLLVVPLNTGNARIITQESDNNNVTAEWWSEWAADGKGFYYISDRDNDYHLYYEPLTGGLPMRLTSGTWAIFSAASSDDHQFIFYTGNQDALEERQVFKLTPKSSHATRITSAHGTHAPVISPNGRFIADIFSSDSQPPELYLQPATAVRNAPPLATQITHSPLSDFKDYAWVTAQYVKFPNTTDRTILHARLTLPPSFDATKRYPAILGSVYNNTVHNQWGGRIYHPTWALDQFLAQQGYVIMNVDISGSSGYGKAFRQRIAQDYGGVDVEDLFSAAQYLIKTGYVNPARIGIWGSSYGGLLTTMSLFTKPGVYKVGVAGAPATSLFHAQTGEMRTMLGPQDHAQTYSKSSAFLKSGALQDHLLIIHGMRDDTVLFKDSITLVQRLILQGHDVDLVALPDAPHGWDTKGLAQTRFAFHKLVDYFDRYLK